MRCWRCSAPVPEPAILPAEIDDVTYFSRRRFHDEEGRQLYVDLARAAPERVLVAKDEGTPVAIAIGHALEDESVLSEIFVEPSFRRSGIARRLLREGRIADPDLTRSGVLDANEPGGAAFFLHCGISVQTPVLHVAGALPHENELARMAAGEHRFVAETLDPVGHRGALREIDRRVRGSGRAVDHLYFSENARGCVFALGGELAGYAYVWPSGRVGPLAAASPAYLVQLFGYALAMLRSTFGASWCTTLVPGTNLRIMRTCLKAGLGIKAFSLFASDAALQDLSCYVGFHTLLF